jgi:hypothetical protein
LSAATVGTAQATELVHGPLATGLPVVLTCDCNAARAGYACGISPSAVGAS